MGTARGGQVCAVDRPLKDTSGLATVEECEKKIVWRAKTLRADNNFFFLKDVSADACIAQAGRFIRL